LGAYGKRNLAVGPIEANFSSTVAERRSGWHELWTKEDWWAIWLGLGIVLVGYVLFAYGSSLKWIAVTPAKWSNFAQLGDHFAGNIWRYAVQFVLWIAVLSVALTALGHRARDFIPAFALVYVLSILIFALGQWDRAATYNLEPPLVALAVGLLISNLFGLPHWLDAGFRVEFYVKLGIVLLGATLPFTLIIWAGPVAIGQASIVSIITFLVIFSVAKYLGIDRRFAATLGVGGAVCGVSAAIAVGSAVGARKEHVPVAITLVIVWAIVMIFVLPLVSRALGLPAGVAGAWIGSSEFADAAGFAAAQSYGDLAAAGAVPGNSDQAVWAFTLMKVVGRDVWIGIWAFILAVLATMRWERETTGQKPSAAEIWWRFPKFVLGFLVASVIVTAATRGYTIADYNKTVSPALVAPIKDLRTWAFIFCFLSIGLTTRFGELAKSGSKPLIAFTCGVAVNVVLGFVLSAVVFAGHWAALGR
jgi:uncharacterized integral membrane protein (TIGR00698 family)